MVVDNFDVYNNYVYGLRRWRKKIEKNRKKNKKNSQHTPKRYKCSHFLLWTRDPTIPKSVFIPDSVPSAVMKCIHV